MRTIPSLSILACTVLLNVDPTAAEQSGFLGDYSMLRPGKEGETHLIYRKYDNDHARWASYNQILLEPVQVWKGKDADLNSEHAEYIAKLLWSRLDEELGKDYKMTTQPGPGVLRIQAAITGAGETLPASDIRTSLPSGTRLIYEKKNWDPGTEAFVADVSAEMKVSDAQSGGILAASVDRRKGDKNASGHVDQWAEVEKIISYWAKQTRWRACLERGGTECHKP